MRLVPSAHGSETSRRRVPYVNVQWESQTVMDEEKKDQVLFAMSAAESVGLEGWHMARHIRDKMETLYGGTWIAARWPSGNVIAAFHYVNGFFADFNYAREPLVSGQSPWYLEYRRTFC